MSENGHSESLQDSNGFAAFKTDTSKLYKVATRSTELKTDSPKLFKVATRFADVKKDS